MQTPVPCLVTAQTGPIQLLEQHILMNQSKIEAWFRKKWREYPAPFYSSVDLRNAGFKLAPVDTNLFPAGFNNLNPDFLPLCVQAVQAVLERLVPGCTRILLIPENHSRNMFYFASIERLQEILLKAGYEVRIGSIDPELTDQKTISLASNQEITLFPVIRVENKLKVTDFEPCFILLNNDLSDGIPPILENLQQTIIPSVKLSWATRLKSKHFQCYDLVSHEFAKLIDIDPWLINPIFNNCDQVDFMTGEGDACLYTQVEKIFTSITDKYREYHIDKQPFVVIKADAGTYGMGVMMVNSPEEIKNLNRKERTKMSVGKGKQKITNVIIQEGVYTFESVGSNHAVAEPVVYMIGQHVVGGFYRVHTQKGPTENLNAPGMHFEPLAFVCPCNAPEFNQQTNCETNRFYAYGVIARLAALAAAMEA
jgi:glutamate--cysteine ligase